MLTASQFLAQKHRRVVTGLAKFSRQVRHWSPTARKSGARVQRVGSPCFVHSSKIASASNCEYDNGNFVNQRQPNYSTRKLYASLHCDNKQRREEVNVSLLGCGQQRQAPRGWASPLAPISDRYRHPTRMRYRSSSSRGSSRPR